MDHEIIASGSVLGQFLEVLPVALLAGVLYCICSRIAKKTLKIRCLLFVCYVTGLAALVLVPLNFWSSIWFFLRNGYSGGSMGHLFFWEYNFVPTVWRVLAGEMTLGPWVIKMLVGNFLMFVPLGIFMPLVFPEMNRKINVLLALAIPFAVEVLQPVIGRSFDIDDVILNALGILAGYLLVWLCRTKIRRGGS